VAEAAVVRLWPRSELGALDDLHAALAELWAAAPGVAAGERTAFTTAVAEVLANVVRHAQVPPGCRIEVELRADGPRLRAEIVDDGEPYREPDVEDPVPTAADGDGLDVLDLAESGRGLPIARAIATVAYERDGGRNRWTVERG